MQNMHLAKSCLKCHLPHKAVVGWELWCVHRNNVPAGSSEMPWCWLSAGNYSVSVGCCSVGKKPGYSLVRQRWGACGSGKGCVGDKKNQYKALKGRGKGPVRSRGGKK